MNVVGTFNRPDLVAMQRARERGESYERLVEVREGCEIWLRLDGDVIRYESRAVPTHPAALATTFGYSGA